MNTTETHTTLDISPMPPSIPSQKSEHDVRVYTWESMATSWLFPDKLHILLRMASLATVMAIYVHTVRHESGTITRFSRGVWELTMFSISLLLLTVVPGLAELPQELWRFVGFVLQLAITGAIFWAGAYYAIGGDGAIHITCGVVLAWELVFGGVRMECGRVMAGGIWVGLSVVGLGRVGRWAVVKGWTAIGLVAGWIGTGMIIVAVGWGRDSLAMWWERRRNEEEISNILGGVK